MNETERVVHSFTKNSREDVVARLNTFRGLELAYLRVYVHDELGDARPTPKGVSIRVEQLPELRAAVDALIAAHEERLAA